MSLGRQFENTYWEDPETGETHSWTRSPSVGGIVPSHRPMHQIDAADVLASPERPLQGLLFHPSTGTGLKDDPTVPIEDRRNMIRKVFDLVSPERYKSNLGRIVKSQRVENVVYKQDAQGKPIIESIRENLVRNSSNSIGKYRGPEGQNFYNRVQDPKNPGSILRQAFTTHITAKISDRQAQKHMDWITDATSDTDIPMHILAKRSEKPLAVVLDPTPGRAYIEGGGSNVRLTYPKGKTSKVTFIDVEKDAPSDIPIHNPKFWKQLDATDRGDSHEPVTADEVMGAATHWVNPTTGHILKPEDEELSNLRESVGSFDTLEHLKTQGYFPNLFSGSGTKLPKGHVLGKVHDIETGYAWTNTRDYYYNKFHTRFAADTTKPKQVVRERVVTKAPPRLDSKTIIHEYGHALDPSLGDRYNNQYLLDTYADPLKEGIADAVADRYVRYQGQFSDTLTDPKQRLEDFHRSGYSIGYSGWKNNLHRALYVGARYHAGASDNNIETLPSRETLGEAHEAHIENLIRNVPYDKRAKARSDFLNTMALGQMYDKFSHIHGILRQAGLEETARQAHAEYVRRTRGSATQPTLPGMEKFV